MRRRLCGSNLKVRDSCAPRNTVEVKTSNICSTLISGRCETECFSAICTPGYYVGHFMFFQSVLYSFCSLFTESTSPS